MGKDIEIKNGKHPYIGIDLDPKEWILILIVGLIAYGMYLWA
tara:strand:- start:267 stop:392 length:126 start_codon:yes stop_codon:yes gene_type:complete